MKANRFAAIANQTVFILLWVVVAGLVLFASDRYHYQADWTATGRNSLSAPSVAIVKALHKPVTVEAFVHSGPIRHNIGSLIGKYQRVDPRIHLTFINPDKHPALVRRLGITFNGELRVRYDNRSALVLSPTETGVTNLLARLERTGLRRITFLTGNDERKATRQTVLGLSSWANQLRARGFDVASWNLASGGPLTTKAGVLVIADPRIPFLAGEIATLKAYIHNGGNVLWLLEPHHATGLSAVMGGLGVRVRHGFAVDPTSSLLTGASPDFIAIDRYPQAGPVRGMHLVTVFPTATSLTLKPIPGVKTLPILRSNRTSWQQRAPLGGLVQPPTGVMPSALILGLALQRAHKTTTQRMAVIADSDFASNSYIGEGGNLTLAMNLANWLANDDAFINLPNRSSPDLTLSLTRIEEDVMAFGFLLILPILILASGFVVWWRRRRL